MCRSVLFVRMFVATEWIHGNVALSRQRCCAASYRSQRPGGGPERITGCRRWSADAAASTFDRFRCGTVACRDEGRSYTQSARPTSGGRTRDRSRGSANATRGACRLGHVKEGWSLTHSVIGVPLAAHDHRVPNAVDSDGFFQPLLWPATRSTHRPRGVAREAFDNSRNLIHRGY